MHNDYYYTDIKGTPFRWTKKFYYIPETTFCQVYVSVTVKCWLTVWLSLLVPPVSEWLSPEVMENTSSEEMCQLKPVCHFNSVIYSINKSLDRLRCMSLWPACLGRHCISPRPALLKRNWLVFFRAPWSGTARCRPGRWMVKLGLWKWAFKHYVGYPSVFIGDVEACDVTVSLCLDNRTYCNTEEQHEHRHLTQIQAIKLFMTGRRQHLKCNSDTLLHDYKEILTKENVVLGQKDLYLFIRSLKCSAILCRWQRADPGGVIWCCGHCSTGGLLDWTGSQQVRVRTFFFITSI